MFHGGALGWATATPKPLLHPKDIDQSYLSSSAQRTRSRKSKEPKCSHCRWTIWQKSPAKLKNFITQGNGWFFFQKDSLLILPCCCIFAQHQCPHWWTSCPRTEVCSDRNYSQIISDIRKKSHPMKSMIVILRSEWIFFCLNCNITATSERHTEMR